MSFEERLLPGEKPPQGIIVIRQLWDNYGEQSLETVARFEIYYHKDITTLTGEELRLLWIHWYRDKLGCNDDAKYIISTYLWGYDVPLLTIET